MANLSVSDLRRLDGQSFRYLARPVAEFISRRKGDAIGRRGRGRPDAAGRVIGCRSTQDTKVRNALDDVASNIWQALGGGHPSRRGGG